MRAPDGLQMTDPEHHPVLKIIGMVSVPDDDLGIDVAREHDEYLAATEIASWSDHLREPGKPDSE